MASISASQRLYSLDALRGFDMFWIIGAATVVGNLTKATGSLINNSALVGKVYFPRVILPFSTVLSTLFDVGISVAVLAIFMLALALKHGKMRLADTVHVQ